jgi:hypothetical protein
MIATWPLRRSLTPSRFVDPGLWSFRRGTCGIRGTGWCCGMQSQDSLRMRAMHNFGLSACRSVQRVQR